MTVTLEFRNATIRVIAAADSILEVNGIVRVTVADPPEVLTFASDEVSRTLNDDVQVARD